MPTLIVDFKCHSLKRIKPFPSYYLMTFSHHSNVTPFTFHLFEYTFSRSLSFSPISFPLNFESSSSDPSIQYKRIEKNSCTNRESERFTSRFHLTHKYFSLPLLPFFFVLNAIWFLKRVNVKLK